MTIDPIVQEVREARAAIAAEFGYDLSQYLVWIREQTQIRKESLNKTGLNKPWRQQARPHSQPRASLGNVLHAPPGPLLERFFCMIARRKK